MEIQWFPGHMTKTRKLIQEHIKNIDVVIEVLDARAPLSSRNPLLDGLINHKPRLVVLNKEDLADPAATKKWIEYLREDKIRVVAVSSTERKHIQDVTTQAKILNTRRTREYGSRVMITGIPNVGKSALINALVRRKKAATGNRPGLTRGVQMVNAQGGLLVLDTPGILWHKFEDPEVGVRLALLGTIKDEILPIEELAMEGGTYMLEHYPEALISRYGEDAATLTPAELITRVGEKRGCVAGGGKIDRDRASVILIRELRSGQLGNISLEWPPTGNEVKGLETEENT